MIIPNLMVRDIRRSIAFYTDILGMTVSTTVSADQRFATGGDIVEDAVFATLEWDGAQLMLQSADSLAAELPVFAPGQQPTPSGTVYFRGFDPDAVAARVSDDQVVKQPAVTWYGMKEIYLRDPDGYVICLGRPEGGPPA